MTKAKLDAAFCATASCPPYKKRVDYWDTQIPGFILECRPSGGKTYWLRYFDHDQRQRSVKIGRYGDITHDTARKKAKQLRSQAVLGGDPAGDKTKRKAVPTYARLAEQHIAHARTYQKRPENTERVINAHLIPRWGKLKLTEITSQEIARWFGEKAEEGLAPATVEKIRVVFGKGFELARQWKLFDSNPVRDVPRRKFSNARERYLTAAEAKRLMAAVEQSANTQLKHIVKLLLLTGARKNELLQAQWKHVDLERKAWLIPDSKTGKARYVPLSQAAIAIIKGLPTWEKCPWLLPNPETTKPYTCIKHPWVTARKKAKLPDLRIHDLRHSAASFMINAGIDLYAVGRILGHADHQSTMRYSHLADDTLLAAVEAGAAGLNLAPVNQPSA